MSFRSLESFKLHKSLPLTTCSLKNMDLLYQLSDSICRIMGKFLDPII